MVYLRSGKRTRRLMTTLSLPVKSRKTEKNGRGWSCRSSACNVWGLKYKKNNHPQQQKQLNRSFESPILEIEFIRLPYHLRYDRSANDPEYVARCAANRAARMAKRRLQKAQRNKTQPLTGTAKIGTSNAVSVQTESNRNSPAIKVRRGPKYKYYPDNIAEITYEELQLWRREYIERRNRITARASYESRKQRVKEFEQKVKEYQTQFDDAQHQISILQLQQQKATFTGTTNTTTSKGPNMPSRYFVTTSCSSTLSVILRRRTESFSNVSSETFRAFVGDEGQLNFAQGADHRGDDLRVGVAGEEGQLAEEVLARDHSRIEQR